jgi:hypothetical protein
MAGEHYEPGHMDISQHKKTWSGFVRFTTWSIVLIGALMTFMLIFRTHG